ncbi:hypothetical protein Adu01nite_37900 [Paractinoplanes durhamensis]|uniref:Integral membrane protein n=1 Tax=Paractinoplanes durhamensis TaxID=113563 RepID=A0ABQ3YY35_9ACTN|nr:hypothetical protein Adu01nite_37900 [Actinoplanes durhamensis]
MADGLAPLEEMPEDFWVTSALVRVRGLDGMLVAAAGGLSAWSRTLISSALVFPLLWAVAWAAGAVGLGAVWVIVLTVLALAVAMPALLWVTGRLSRTVDSRRMGPAPAAGEAGKEDVVEVLLRARVRLVSAALRQVGSRRWDAGHLTRLVHTDRVVSRIADADLLLCQAIDFLEIHAAEQRRGMVA